MEIDFQAIEAADIESGVLETLLMFVEEYYAYDGHSFDPARMRGVIANLVRHPEWGRVWFIRRDRRPAGYMVLTLGYSLEYGGRDAFVDEIYIQECDRNQGLGRAAFRFLRAVCRSLEVKALHLEVEHSNGSAKAAYRKWGFVEHDRYLMTHWIAPDS